MVLRRHALLLMVLSAAVASCGNDDGSEPSGQTPPPTSPAPTVEQAIQNLEAAGRLPVLDRSTGLMANDINNDGIRDDIASYILAQSFNPPQVLAAQQMARAFQRVLTVDKADKVQLDKVALEQSRAINCIFARFPEGSVPGAGGVVYNLRIITANTRERLSAFLAFSNARDGSVGSLPVENTCE